MQRDGDLTGTTLEFDKSSEAFPGREQFVFLAACSASPLYSGALERLTECARLQAESGALVFGSYEETLDRLHRTAARLLGAGPDDISFHRNTSEAISMIAGGYPFEPGDEVVSYVHEYPANHYPWRNLAHRGVNLVELSNVAPSGCGGCRQRPCAFSLDELAERLSPRTRIVSVSHVQFTSGHAVDVAAIAELCRQRGVDLVLDAAQSLGALPLHPVEHGIAAVASAGWKWLLGPLGSGLMYTSHAFRKKLGHVIVGAEVMRQGVDYLDHSWTPHETAKRFEYATSSPALAAALEASISEIHLRYGVAAIRDELLRLQDLLIDRLSAGSFTPLRFANPHRSGILSVICRAKPPEELAGVLLERGFVASARGGYLRIAPHFFVTDAEIERLADTMNRIGT